MPLSYEPFMALQDVDAAYLKDNYLIGFKFLDDNGQPLADAFFEAHLQNALGTLEETTHVDVLQRAWVGEKHDYRVNEYLSYGFLQLFRIPCQTVTGIRAVFPAGNTVQVFPSEWIRLETTHSSLNLVPVGGTISQIITGQGGYYPLVWFSPYLPQLWEVDYVSGFPPDKIPRIIVEAIAKLAAVSILTILSNLVTPLGVGSQSLGVDGLSQSRSYSIPAFRMLIDAYTADLWGPSRLGGGLIDQIRKSFLGFLVTAA